MNLEADARTRFPGNPAAQAAWIAGQTGNPTFNYATGALTADPGSNSVLIGALVAIGGAGFLYMLWKKKR